VTGGDLVANSLYVLAAVAAVAGTSGKPRWAAYLVCGIAFSSRPSFWLALLPLAAHLHARGRRAREASAAVLLVLAAVTLPFYLWDPPAFSPLHVLGKLAGARSLVPGGDWALVAAAALLVLTATRRIDGRVESLLEAQCFALWLPPAMTTAAMWLISDYRWAEFLYFALPAAVWAVVRVRSERAS
jgi:hypothetical protein